MAYGTLLPSARDQWYQWTYAVLPNGNWDAGGQHICLLDNGEVWMFMSRVMSFFNAYPFEEAGFNDYLGESEFQWIGKVHPNGNERVGGDEMVYGAEPGSESNSFGYPYPKFTDSYLPESGWGYRGSYSSDGTMVTDGTLIYMFKGNHVNSGRPPLWYKLDPATYEFEIIAGGYINPLGGGSPFIDDPIGVSATFNEPAQALYHEGYVYWIEPLEGPGGAARTVRRMSVAPPYGIETWTPDFSTPAGYPGDATAHIWFDQINPSTGLPNIFNDDLIGSQGSSTQIVGFGIWDGYMYFSSMVTGNAHQYFYLKRCPFAGGPLETLLYGIGYLNLANVSNDSRDNQVDSAEYPSGIKHQTLNIWYPSHHYTPDLEGLDTGYTTMLVTPDGSLFMQNHAGALFGQNEWGIRIIRLSLPDLIAAYESDGPQRINRADPQWDTLTNGQTFWNAATPGNQPDVFQFGTPANWPRLRFWSGRDGNNPLMSHVLTTGWTFNWNAPEFDGKILFVHPEISESVGALQYTSTATNNTMMVAVLQEEGGGPLDVRLNFEGVALKAYSHAPGLPVAAAPEEVTLT